MLTPIGRCPRPTKRASIVEVDTAPRKQQSASETDLRHPLERDPLADSWTIEVPAEKWEQVMERFDGPPAPGEGSAKTEAAYRLLFG